MNPLPFEPVVTDPARQRMLTERYLLPALPALRALFLHLRAEIDPVLAAREPARLGKPYPLGRCFEIAQAVQQALARLDTATLPAAAAEGSVALARFQEQGGSARLVWGVQHGVALRHAFLFGTLCIDVAQDSTDAALAPVSIVPFAQARLTPVRDHRQFALLAGSAWQAHVFPNHMLPELAPYAPLIVLVPGGSVRLEADARYMLALARRSGFASSAAVLTLPGMADNLFALTARTLADAGFAVAADADQGKAAALEACRQCRDTGARAADLHAKAMTEQLAQANRALQIMSVSVRAAGT